MRLAIVASVALLVLGITTPILALNRPATVTSTYEVPEPKTWLGKELPILKYIDIGEKLKTGIWLVLFYHYDCPNCQKAILLQYQQMARDLSGNEDFLRVAFVEIPPFSQHGLREDPAYYTLGRLVNVKDWFVTTPAVALLANVKVHAAWEEEAPKLDVILAEIAGFQERIAKKAILDSVVIRANSLERSHERKEVRAKHRL